MTHARALRIQRDAREPRSMREFFEAFRDGAFRTERIGQ
jgi:hypothetical protein